MRPGGRGWSCDAAGLGFSWACMCTGCARLARLQRRPLSGCSLPTALALTRPALPRPCVRFDLHRPACPHSRERGSVGGLPAGVARVAAGAGTHGARGTRLACNRWHYEPRSTPLRLPPSWLACERRPPCCDRRPALLRLSAACPVPPHYRWLSRPNHPGAGSCPEGAGLQPHHPGPGVPRGAGPAAALQSADLRQAAPHARPRWVLAAARSALCDCAGGGGRASAGGCDGQRRMWLRGCSSLSPGFPCRALTNRRLPQAAGGAYARRPGAGAAQRRRTPAVVPRLWPCRQPAQAGAVAGAARCAA